MIPQKSAPAAPHLLGQCSQSPRRPRLSLRSALPHFTDGAGGGQGSHQEASRPGSPKVALLALAGAKLCEVCLSISFLQGPSHYVPCGLKLPRVLFGLEWRFHYTHFHSSVNDPDILIYLKFQQFSKKRTIFNGGI